MEGTLSVVGTPIGNLGDITLRALETLKNADVIFCEDTRVTAKLLARYEISKPLVRCDENKEKAVAEKAIAMLAEGKRIALVTDAGTPGISDPGSRLVGLIRAHGGIVKIEAIPGPSALTAALSIAGVPSTEFIFLGFLTPIVIGVLLASFTHPLYERLRASLKGSPNAAAFIIVAAIVIVIIIPFLGLATLIAREAFNLFLEHQGEFAWDQPIAQAAQEFFGRFDIDVEEILRRVRVCLIQSHFPFPPRSFQHFLVQKYQIL